MFADVILQSWQDTHFERHRDGKGNQNKDSTIRFRIKW